MGKREDSFEDFACKLADLSPLGTVPEVVAYYYYHDSLDDSAADGISKASEHILAATAKGRCG